MHSTPEEASQVPIAKQIIQNNLFVDDGIARIPSTADAVCLTEQATIICDPENVCIPKCISNYKGVLASVPESQRTKELHSLDLNQKTLPPARTLGVGWCTDSDRFQFYMNLKEEPATRWEIRSTFAPVYGPLGLIAPYPPQRRQIMQELCKLKSTLDEELDEVILVKCKMKISVALPPPGTLSGADVYSRERWRQVQWLANAFREGRRKTCLALLQARQKWSDKKCCLKEGDLVILKEDNPIRGTWRLEIVDSVEVSSDGLTRSVRLRMSTDRLTDKGGGQSRVPIDQFTSWW